MSKPVPGIKHQCDFCSSGFGPLTMQWDGERYRLRCTLHTRREWLTLAALHKPNEDGTPSRPPGLLVRGSYP